MSSFILFFAFILFNAAKAADRVEMISPSTGLTWRSFNPVTASPTTIGRINFLQSAPSSGVATVTTVVNIKIETCAGGTCSPIKLGSSGILKAFISSPTGAQVSPEIILPFSISNSVPFRISQEIPLTVTVHGKLSTAGTYSLALVLLGSGSSSDSPFQYKLNYGSVLVVNE